MLITRLGYPLLIPLALMIVGLWLRDSITLVPDTYLSLMHYLPAILFIASSILCLQFNQYRSLLISIFLSLSYFIIQQYLQDPLLENSALTVFILLTTFLPLLVLMISWFPERGIATSYGLLLFALACLIPITAYYIFLNPDLLIPVINYLSVRDWQYSVLSPLGIFIFCAVIAHQLTRLWLYSQPIDAALSIILLSLLINFALFDLNHISIAVFSSIQLILIWSLLKQSHDMAYRDELTGLPGRRALNEALKSPGRNYVIAMMDIDFFKKFNDKYGHDVGDDVLKVVASKMALVTGGGRAYRYGGEEFTVLFKGKSLESCIPHLQAVREDIARYELSIREKASRPKTSKEGKPKRGRKRKGKAVTVTISIGVAKRTADMPAPEQVMKAADKALYKAKKAGRNCLETD